MNECILSSKSSSSIFLHSLGTKPVGPQFPGKAGLKTLTSELYSRSRTDSDIIKNRFTPGETGINYPLLPNKKIAMQLLVMKSYIL